ncbi:MAG: hypothetical protein DHS20C18_40460 [Saprospiraceae bacterium]|nr:MAG: hypothetical protein DHS20C18_40460 [Saprospiraceae bacterium]
MLFLFIVTSFWFCDRTEKPAEETELVEAPYINISSTVPKDIARTASIEDIAKFAWEEFLALNWKSSYTTANPKRGQADNSWSYQSAGAYPDLLVWETYAHRTELRPFFGKIMPFNSAPHYSFGDTSNIKPAPGENPSFELFNNLDENNEIGSCDVYAHGSLDQMVLYQAKVNQDEYDYFMQNLEDTTVLKTAISNTFNNLVKYKAYYEGATSSCNCPPAQNVICLPCGGAQIPNGNGATYEGAIEVKTAWRKLDPAKDDTTRFYMKKVLYYTQGPGETIYYHNAVFGLVGIHIIHKTQNFPDFIFASWEQVDDRNANMNYVILDPNTGKETGGLKPVLDNQHVVPAYLDSVTNKVWSQLKGLNKESIWQYYRLIGVQSLPYNSLAEDPSKNYYMANFVIESDSFLSVFSGPGFGVDSFSGNNLIYDTQLFNMGGCKGCHGVAQTSFGTDFSFLLDFGNGKPTFAPDLLKMGTPANAQMLEASKKYLVGTELELK